LGPWKLEPLETRDEEEILVKRKREQRKRNLPALGPWKLEMKRKYWSKRNGRGDIEVTYLHFPSSSS
jgi:hypothetical protein